RHRRRAPVLAKRRSPYKLSAGRRLRPRAGTRKLQMRARAFPRRSHPASGGAMFTKLLVPLDNSELAEQALPTAEWLARAGGAAVELVYVHQPSPGAGYADAPWNAARRSSEESYVRAIADEIRTGASLSIHGALATGSPAEAICTRAVEVGA